MLQDEEDFRDTSIGDAATRGSTSSSSSTPILLRLKPISSNGNGEIRSRAISNNLQAL